MRDEFDPTVADRFTVLDQVPVPDTWMRVQSKVLDHMPAQFPEEETTMIDLEAPRQSDEHRKGPKLILLGCLAAAASVAIIAVVAIQGNEPASTPQAADTGPITLAKGDDVEFVGEDGLAGETLNVNAVSQNGHVTGEFRIADNVTTIECADTRTKGVIILGGQAASGSAVTPGELLALIIREGNPDSVSLFANEFNAGSCVELLASIPDDKLTNDSQFAVVEQGYDIKTG